MDNANADGENGEASLPSISKVINKVSGAYNKLNGQITKAAAALQIKTEVCDELREAVNLLRLLRNMLCDEAAATLTAMKTEMKELKTSMNEVKEATKVKPTYSQAANPIITKTMTTRANHSLHEVTLRATKDNTKESLATIPYQEITKMIQKGIDHALNVQPGVDKPVLQGVSRPTKHGTVSIRCRTEAEANALREINWEKAVGGFEAQKPKYGIVVHKLNSNDYNTLINKGNGPAIKHVGKANSLPIISIAPLLRKNDNDAIIIFTSDPHAADRCISQGIYINYRLYSARKYTPEIQLTQCYNCGNYGHRAAQCTKKQQCGKCGEDNHGTRDCKHSGKPKCSNCHGNHENWHYKCHTRITERRRLKGLRARIPPFFTS